MPTLVLNHKTPFECLLKSTPDYMFLRTFGCLSFPFLRLYTTQKLDFRSSPCVFLGYSTSHLGYRCLDLSSHRLYIARHVQFHETVFPFDKSEQHIASPIQPPVVTFQPLTSVSTPYLAKSSAPTKPLAPTSTSLAPLFLPAYHDHIHSTGTGPDLSLSHVSPMALVSPDLALSSASLLLRVQYVCPLCYLICPTPMFLPLLALPLGLLRLLSLVLCCTVPHQVPPLFPP